MSEELSGWIVSDVVEPEAEEEEEGLSEIDKRFNQFDDEFLKFERIPEVERLNPSYFISGLIFLGSLLKNPSDFDSLIHSDYDILYLPGPDDLKKELTDVEIIYLQRCGIHYNSEDECFAKFT
jgi:hypothetical protein